MNILIDGHDISLVGGIERFTSALANAMSARGHRVFLFTYARQGTPRAFSLSPEVRLVHYQFTGDPAHIPALRKQILDCEPDVFVSPASYNNHLLWCAALAGTNVPWIYSEHSDPGIIATEHWNRPEREAALCVADRVHLLLESYADTVPSAARDRVCVIPNPLVLRPGTADKPAGSAKTLLSLGRLDAIKQNHILIAAFASLSADFQDWQLDIWGEGGERPRLQRQVASLGLQDKISLCGAAIAPEEQYARAGFFCIPSRFEGFPNTVIEAMSHGLPVVGFAGCTALNSLVRHGETGLLAPEMSAESLAETLRPLMENADLRRRLGENARVAAAAYAPERIFDAWEALLSETSACKGKTRLRECMSGGPLEAVEPELERHYAVLREIMGRKNVLLRDDQWLRRFVRRYPILRTALRPARQSLRRLVNAVRA